MPLKRSTRPVKKVKRETAATETDIDAALQSGDTFEQIFGGYPDHSDNVSDVSDASDYGRRRKQPATKGVRKQGKPPSRRLTLNRPPVANARAADPMSDNEYDSEAGSGIQWLKSGPRTLPESRRQEVLSTTVAKLNHSTPNILQIHVNTASENGGSTVNVDLTPLLSALNAGATLNISPDNDETLIGGDDDSTLSPNSHAVTPSLRVQHLNEARIRALRADTAQETKTGFTDLPTEIRLRIYRLVFATEAPINFHTRKNFQRSSSLLATCRIAHEEGRAVMYGENAFHFERSYGARGRFFEEDWREIGFKDIRRFLETIGPTNVSMMRYVSFDFGDASKTNGPVEEMERRFVNDPVVWHCLELIGSSAHLAKFAFQISGRRTLDRTDLHFLRALTSIKSQEVINVANFSGGYKVKPELLADLKKLMVVPRDDPEKVDGKKKKAPTVVMHHERNRGTRYYEVGWR